MARSDRTVSHRRVFYVPGYDPMPPRRYRELYRTEGARQAEISGYELSIRARKGERFGWHVESVQDGQRTHTEFEVLLWADLVKKSMEAGILGTYAMLFRTAWTYARTGALRRLTWLRLGPVIAALYPVVVLLLQLLAALVVAGALGWALSLAHPMAAWLGLLAVWPVLEAFRRKDARFFAYYLMHDYAFSARYLGANPPVLEARIAEFTSIVAEALTKDTDEVLVIGHSSGAHVAISVLADLVREGRVPANGPALSFLSLGQCVPMVSFLPEAGRLRADLHDLSATDALAWVDVTAPADGATFALCDPAGVSGVAPDRQTGPTIFSAAFTDTMSEESLARIKWRFFLKHLQYLCAFEHPRDYDYFRITAGPLTLGDRYKGRITRAASPHVTMERQGARTGRIAA